MAEKNSEKQSPNLCENVEESILNAVSYTHLDVYKRQIHN